MKKAKLFLTTLLLTATMSMAAFAGEWKQDTTGWWYQNDDGSYPTNQWQEIGGKQYYFGADGYMFVNTATPDGKQVGADGALAQTALFDFDTEKWHVKYTGFEPSNDYKGNPCIIIYYDFTNKDTEPKSAMSAWIDLKAYQNGVECDTSTISYADGNQSVENEYKKVMSGVTINVGKAFAISDKSPITFIVKDTFDWSDNAPSVTATLNIE